jgi:ribosomal protein L29
MSEKKKVKFEEMSKSEIEKFLEDRQAKMIKLRFDISSKQIKNHREYRNTKKDIARAITALKNKQE